LVHYLHINPFNVINGLKKTVEELDSFGKLIISDVPTPNPPKDKTEGRMFVDLNTWQLSYEYVDSLNSVEDKIVRLQDRCAALETVATAPKG
jgi:hypothetical protein